MSGRDTDQVSISAVATDTIVVEAAEPFVGLGRIELGDTIVDPSTREFFGPVRQTRRVRAFTLRQATLHGPTMSLFSGGRKMPETRYRGADESFASARITDAIPVAGESPVVIGFNQDWWGYYHWVVQCLPAIDCALQQETNAAARIALPKLDGWHAELLNLLGYGAVDRVEIDVERCYTLPSACYIECLNGFTAAGISRSAARTFHRLCKRARVSPTPHEAIYVSRADSARRPIRNEQALMRMLEAEGVTIVVPGVLSVVDQIALFRGARVVIGGHGGGLTNIVFCPDEAAVYELLPSHYRNPCFNRLAQVKGLDYWADLFTSDGQGHVHQQSWVVDLELIKRRLDTIRESVRGPGASGSQRGAASPPVSTSGELFAFYTGTARSRPLHKWHHYFDIYEKHLSLFRRGNPILLELGVEQGGGLEMWRAYFGPACRLFGIDSDPSATRHEDVADRVFIGDQRDRGFLRDVLRQIGRPDVVINDGAHTASQQIAAFEELYPAMSEDGIYIVEDTHTSFWGSAYLDRQDPLNFFTFACVRCAELMAWTSNRADFALLGTEQNIQLWNKVPEFCRSTKQISFFDSMIVFERGRRSVPRHEQR